MGRAWKTREVHTAFWWGDLMERDHLEHTGIEWTIMLKWIFKKWDGEAWTGLDWTDLAQNRDMWLLPVNAVMNLRVP